MQLEKPEVGDDSFRLVMSPVEWNEVYALAKFARGALDYDTRAAYVAQVFVYVISRPEQILGNKSAQAAFTAIDELAAEVASGNRKSRDVVLHLSKEPMRQLLIVLGLAAESEDQADIVHDGYPDELPLGYPAREVEVAAIHYAEAFEALLDALHEDRTLRVDRPVYPSSTDE